MNSSEIFLIEFYKQCQERMRQTSDFEYRLLWYLLLFFPIIGVMMSSLYGSSIKPVAYFWISLGVSLFLAMISGFMTHKICRMHNTYNNVGQHVKKVWRYFSLSTKGAYLEKERIIPENLVVTDRKKGFGAGIGYKQTLYIIWALTAVMMIVIIALGVLRFVSEEPLSI